MRFLVHGFRPESENQNLFLFDNDGIFFVNIWGVLSIFGVSTCAI